MRLSPDQIAQFNRDGYLTFPDLVSEAELSVLRKELARLHTLEAEGVTREKSGSPRTVWRFHESDGPTASSAFRALSRTPRLLAPAQQVLGHEQLYIIHSKANIKTAIDGTVWGWHQDYGSWQFDGVPTGNIATFLVMLEEATEFSGCLYFVPGSHRLGVLEPVLDTVTTSWPLWSVPKPRMIDLLRASAAPVPITGKPGTGVLFHANMVHASGHNLSSTDRWHIYFVYNPVANKPRPVEKPRPDWVMSRNYEPLAGEPDDAVLRSPVLVS
jgi:ectoine hydroxylase